MFSNLLIIVDPFQNQVNVMNNLRKCVFKHCRLHTEFYSADLRRGVIPMQKYPAVSN